MTVFISSAAADEPSRDALGVLAEGYERNREAFPVIDCRFDYVSGKVKSIDDGLRGNFVGEVLVQHGHWLVDGSKVRYELLCEPAVAEAARQLMREGKTQPLGGGGIVWLPCIDSLYLRSDSYSLSYGPFHLAANLFAKGDRDGAGIRVTPFNPDILGADEYSNPARYLRDVLNGRFKGTFDGTQQINGRDTLVVTIGDPWHNRFGFDPQRNYLLVYESLRDKRSGWRYRETYITDARECSGGRWFPTRAVVITNPDEQPPFDVRELVVKEFHVDTRPAAELFQLELLKGTQVNRVGHGEWTNLKQAETVRAEDLRELHERCIAYGKEYVSRRESIRAMYEGRGPAAAAPSRLRSLLIVGNVAVVMILGVLGYVKWRRSRAAADTGEASGPTDSSAGT